MLTSMQRFGIWFHHFKEKLTAPEAQSCMYQSQPVTATLLSLHRSVCNSAWNKDSLREILFLIFEIRASSAHASCFQPV